MSYAEMAMVVTGVVLVVFGIPTVVYSRPFWRARKFPSASELAVERFAHSRAPSRNDYLSLVAYFAEGFVTYSSALRTGAHYPGYPSGADRRVQDLEAFSRIAPLLAAWLARQPTSPMKLASGDLLDVGDLLTTAISHGTDPASSEYWGQITDRDQRIVEAADIALALWITRHKIWNRMNAATRARTSEWLRGVNGKEVADNNWHLFVAQVNVVLKSLGQPHSSDETARRLARIKDFYRGDGWFRDGPGGPFDYYNAWGFHYQLGFIHLVDPELLPEFIESANKAFSGQLLYLIGTRGFPIFGRSICYRLAVTAPLIFAATASDGSVKQTEARRALDATWQFFARSGAIKEGRITQGYCGDDPRILDDYSGPASSLWSLRSLIAALMVPADSPFWTESPTPLPIERSDYRVDLEAPGFCVTGTQATGDIVITTQNPLPDSETRLHPYTLRNRIMDSLRPGIRRPANEDAKYRRAEYSSNAPFCGCQRFQKWGRVQSATPMS